MSFFLHLKTHDNSQIIFEFDHENSSRAIIDLTYHRKYDIVYNMEEKEKQDKIGIVTENHINNLGTQIIADEAETKLKNDIDAVLPIDTKTEEPDKMFAEIYNKTGDSTLAAKLAYRLDTEGAAQMKAALALRNDKIIRLIENDVVKNFTLDGLQKESWMLYKKCIKEGNKIKALELLAKLKGYLSDKFVVNNQFNSWNVLISQAHKEENNERAIIESTATSEDVSAKPS